MNGEPVDVNDRASLERQASAQLPASTFAYFAGGAETETTMRANQEAFQRWRFAYHVLRGTGKPSLSVELFGSVLATPVLLAPTAMQNLAHPDGELAVARAAARANTLYCLSTLASRRLEDVVAQSPPGPRWFQLYPCRDRQLNADLLARAEGAGCRAVVLTVDTPISGRRERHGGAGFQMPAGMAYANLTTGDSPPPASSGLVHDTATIFNERFCWDDLGDLIGSTRLPVLVKGVVRGDDAWRAVDLGARGIVVSNHGGRQLDHAVATLDALPEVVEAVGAAVPVLLDGGIRRGTDVIKALALGARAVLIGRPYLWALAVGGEAGVADLLGRIRDELSVSMELLGAASLEEISPDTLRRCG